MKKWMEIIGMIGAILGAASWGKNIREWGELLDGPGVFGGIFLVVGLVLLSGAIWRNHRTLSEMQKRIDRSEWDWNDLKRLHPDLVKDFPPR